jgi:hypothetical protein
MHHFLRDCQEFLYTTSFELFITDCYQHRDLIVSINIYYVEEVINIEFRRKILLNTPENRILKMQLRQLKITLKHIPSGMLMSTYAILHSYMQYETLIEDKNEKITFISLLIYLNDNGFTIIPDLDIRHTPDEQLFQELIEGITQQKFQIQIRDEYLELIAEKYQDQTKAYCFSFAKHTSPLHFAVFYNDYSFAKSLIDSHADVNMNAIFDCILGSAIENSDAKLVQLLLENGANIHNHPHPPLKKNKPNQNILKLLKNAESSSFKEIKPVLLEKINLGTRNCLPTVIINTIASYDPRFLMKGYFQAPTKTDDKKIHNNNDLTKAMKCLSF